MKIAERVRELTESTITELGYRLYDVDFLKEPEGYVLTLYIDNEQPITLDDCEKVSRAIEPLLDEADPITQAYYLSVSSIGLDRPFKLDEDYERNMGKEIDVKLYAPLSEEEVQEGTITVKKSDRIKQFTGTLESYDGTSFVVNATINKKAVKLKIERKSAAQVRLHIDF